MNDYHLANAHGSSAKRVAYIIGRYPSLTKTFIDREVIAAKSLGLNLVIVATRRAEDNFQDSMLEILGQEVNYIFPTTIYNFFRAHAHFMIRRPLRFLMTLGHLAALPHPNLLARLKTIFHFSEGVLAARLLHRIGANHVHAHFADQAVVIAMVVQQLLDIPYSVTAHAHDIYKSPPFLKEKLGSAKFVTTCTSYNRDYLRTLTGRPIELIYHGLDFCRINELAEERQPEQPPLVLSVGRLQEKKGMRDLVKACHLLSQRGYSFRCEIVGAGPEYENLNRMITALSLENVVTMRGAQDHITVLKRYSEASLFVLPCIIAEDGDRDGIPNVILEAMAFGVPVVSSIVSGIPEVIQDGITGKTVAPGDSVALAKAMQDIIDNPSAASQLGSAASIFVRKEFDIRKNVSRLVALLIEE